MFRIAWYTMNSIEVVLQELILQPYVEQHGTQASILIQWVITNSVGFVNQVLILQPFVEQHGTL